MIEAVFISDIHLHPNDTHINKRFNLFLEWAITNQVNTIYILGDFFHVWSGDDLMDDWSKQIAHKIASLTKHNIQVYYLHGNRDFLIGEQFCRLANMTLLPDPHVIKLDQQSILLTHGDQYCTKDRGHQLLRQLTRNKWFYPLFMSIPKIIRKKIVTGFRKQRANAKGKPSSQLEIVNDVMIQDMKKHHCQTIIHGHIHQAGLTKYQEPSGLYQQYVLSDWDDTPSYLCYYKSNGIFFKRGFSNARSNTTNE